ncbi:hypothetical protein FACS189496_1820 [Bacilli bacterium]|nr:hypothetical protein FACS189496_1820 [Bacilli bacterium]
MFYDCKYLQLDGLISTRIHDIPSLQYVQSKNKGGNIKKIGGLASNIITSGTTVQVSSSNPNKLSIVQQIDHYILNTSLGLGYPFFEKSVVDDQEA